MNKLRIGEIKYTNIRPMFHYLNRQQLIQDGCTFTTQIPAQLNSALAEGKIDIGGISSFSYGQNWKQYLLLPNLSVSSFGEVGSIFLFSKFPLEQLEDKTIALTSSSETSNNLLKILFHHYFSIDAAYIIQAPNYDKMMKDYDACLLIGDDAILANLHQTKHAYTYDIGALWYEQTKLPMTYALFAVREETFTFTFNLVKEFYRQALGSKKKCLETNFKDLIQSILKELSGGPSFWQHYFNGLNFDLTEKHIEGLTLYFKLAFQYELLPEEVKEIKVVTFES